MTMAISRSRNRQVFSSAEDLADDVAEAVTMEGVGVPDPPGAAVIIHPPNALRQKVCAAGPAEQAPAAAGSTTVASSGTNSSGCISAISSSL